MLKDYPINCSKQDAAGTTKIRVTARVDLPLKEDGKPDQAEISNVLHFVRAHSTYDRVYHLRNELGLAAYGMSPYGGPRPVFEKPDDRTSPVVAYEQDFNFVPNA